jgi:3-hydroxybutyryl-CoA dehydratase
MAAIEVGQSHSITVSVTPDMIDAFARLSGDAAPLHTDAAFAIRRGFTGPVVHGALIGALVSRLVGMHFPGPDSILERMELAFREPCYAPADLTITARVRQMSEAVASVILDISVMSADGRTLVSGKTAHRLMHEDPHDQR